MRAAFLSCCLVLGMGFGGCQRQDDKVAERESSSPDTVAASIAAGETAPASASKQVPSTRPGTELLTEVAPRVKELAEIERYYEVYFRGIRVGHARLFTKRFPGSGVLRTSLEQSLYPDPNAREGYHVWLQTHCSEGGGFIPYSIWGRGYFGEKGISYRIKIGGKTHQLSRNLFGQVMVKDQVIPSDRRIRGVQYIYHKARQLFANQDRTPFTLPRYAWEKMEGSLRSDVTYSVQLKKKAIDIGDKKIETIVLEAVFGGNPESKSVTWLDDEGYPVRFRPHVPAEFELVMCSPKQAEGKSKELSWKDAVAKWKLSPEPDPAHLLTAVWP